MTRLVLSLAAILSIVSALPARAQQQQRLQEDRSEIIRDYNAVISNLEIVYEFDIVKDSIRVKQHFSKEMELLTDYTKLFAEDGIYFDSFTTVEDLEAYTVVPVNRGTEKVPVTIFNESNDPEG